MAGKPSAGQRSPLPGRVFRKFDIFMIPFSLLWSGVVFYACFISLKSASLLAQPSLLFFVAAAIYLLFGRLIVAYVQNVRTCYAVTDKRLIRTVGNRWAQTALYSVTTLDLTERSDGSGTLIFSYQDDRYDIRRCYSFPGAVKPFTAIENLANVREVYDLVEAHIKRQ